MSEISLTFGDLLRRLRSAAGLSQEELADRSGVSRNGISDLERGRYQAPRFETVRMLADGLGLGADQRATLLAAARPARWEQAPRGRRPPPLIALPFPLTRLIGRESEVAVLRAKLQNDTIRLLTLTGPGGVGKTRLAIEVAGALHETYPDGVVFVDLAPLTDPGLLAPSVAMALGVREVAERQLIDTLSAFLAPKRLLLVLDNCERVLAAAADLTTLLGNSPGLTLFATSREPFHVRGEHVVSVQPLPLPTGDRPQAIEELADVPTVMLFIERAAAVTADFALTLENAPATAEICRRLDGLPLAIELAAARIKILPPAALLAKLEHRLPVLTGGSRDLPARQKTMRDTMVWSYDLHSPEEQVVFRRLSVFVAGFSLEAAEAVANVPGDQTVGFLDRVASLIDTSLLRQEPGVGQEPHFRMLETTREFGLEQLIACGDEEAIRERHAHWYLSLASSQASLVQLAGDPARLARLSAEHGNLRAALGWFAARGDAESLARLTGALNWFWHVVGQGREGRAWLERALAVGAHVSPAARMGMLSGASNLAVQLGDDVRATVLGEELLAVARAEGDRAAEAGALFLLSRAASHRAANTEATAYASELLALIRALDDERWLPWALQRLGIEAYIAGDFTQAAALLAEALAGFRAVGNPLGMAYASGILAMAQHALGDWRQATSLHRESLMLHRDLADPWETGHLLMQISLLAAESSHGERAARLLGAAEALFTATGTATITYERDIAQRAKAAAQAALDPGKYTAMWEMGQEMSFADAVAEGLAAVDAIEAGMVPVRPSRATAGNG